jgi:hypothetical protein
MDMGDRVQRAASQIDMEPGETIGLQFASDRSHPHSGGAGDIHEDAYEVTKKSDGDHKVTKMGTDEKK